MEYRAENEAREHEAKHETARKQALRELEADRTQALVEKVRTAYRELFVLLASPTLPSRVTQTAPPGALLETLAAGHTRRRRIDSETGDAGQLPVASAATSSADGALSSAEGNARSVNLVPITASIHLFISDSVLPEWQRIGVWHNNVTLRRNCALRR